MATYFESRKSNGNFVINDQYLAIQLYKTFNGNQAKYQYQNNEDTYVLDTGNLNAKDVIWGFSLNSILGRGKQSVMLEATSPTQLKVRLFKSWVETHDSNDTWTKRDDASISKFKFYAFTYKRVFSKSPHLAGIEIYDSKSNVVYTSATKTIHIKNVFSGGNIPDERGSVPISWNGEGVFIPIGYNVFIRRDQMCYGSVMGVTVGESNRGTLYRTPFTCTSSRRRPTPYSELLYDTLGCLICELR